MLRPLAPLRRPTLHPARAHCVGLLDLPLALADGAAALPDGAAALPDPDMMSVIMQNTEEAAEAAALDTLGRDILTFLAASVVVVPLSKSLKITPVLGFLLQ